jgi:hypothetical protein
VDRAEDDERYDAGLEAGEVHAAESGEPHHAERYMLAALTYTGLVSLGLATQAHAQRPHAMRPLGSRWVLNGHSTAALGTSVGDAGGSLNTSSDLGGVVARSRAARRCRTSASGRAGGASARPWTTSTRA